MDRQERIAKVEQFRDNLNEYGSTRNPNLRKILNENMRGVRREVIEAGCMKTFTIGPPPAVGGLIVRNADPFDMIFNRPYGVDMNSTLVDILEQTIGVLRDGAPDRLSDETIDVPRIENSSVRGENAADKASKRPSIEVDLIQKGYLFIAMPMTEGHPEYDDVHDAIKVAAVACGLSAERIGDAESNERITDRLLESIRLAEFVVADLTDARPNVFYEAGYANGIGKTPIYIAKKGTQLEFDLKDYPVIFFQNMRELKERLERRLRGLPVSH